MLHTAPPNSYMVITRRDGSIEHRRGPTSEWEDPVKYVRIEVMPALEVEAGEAIVVYREEPGEAGERTVRRQILRGPLMYMPSGLEWIGWHAWHGTSPETRIKPVQVKVPGALRFRKLRTTPDQIYFDIPNVRTRDDALITVQVMAFVQLVDIQKMLDATHDPISEFMSSLSADILDFVGSRTFDQYKSELEPLSDLSSYPHLKSRAATVGYTLSKVVFRGYITSQKLQEMHDDAINRRTELVLQKEMQEQEQDLKDFKLMRDSARAEQLNDFKLKRAHERQLMEKQKVEHQQQLQDLEAEAGRRRRLLEHAAELQLAKESHKMKLEQQQEDNAVAEKHYGHLKGLGVDMSRYLAVVARGPVQRVIEVDGGGRGGGAQLHIHSEDGSGL